MNEKGMIFCPACGEQNPETAGQCGMCSYALTPEPDRGFKTVVDDGQKPAPDLLLEPGTFVAGRYEIVRSLGQGGMGSVFLVKDHQLNRRQMALKMVHSQIAGSDAALKRFRDEVCLCLDLHHDRIIRVHTLQEWNSTLFFTMEYVPGNSLRTVMDQRQENRSSFSVTEALAVGDQLLDALACAHEKTVHRDIKPENIILAADFPDPEIKLLDFGIAKALSGAVLSKTAQSMGTAYYMAPEQIRKTARVDARADLYSVGMILYEMLTGELAVGHFKPVSRLCPEADAGLDEVINTLLAVEPDDRYPDAARARAALSGGARGPETLAKAPESEPALTPRPEPAPGVTDDPAAASASRQDKRQTALERLAAKAKILEADRDWDGLEALGREMESLDPGNARALELISLAKQTLDRMELLDFKIETGKNPYTTLKFLDELEGLSSDPGNIREKRAEVKARIASEQTLTQADNRGETAGEDGTKGTDRYWLLSGLGMATTSLVMFLLAGPLGVAGALCVLLPIGFFYKQKFKDGAGNATAASGVQPSETSRCGSCNAVLDNTYQVGGTCQSPGCDSRICKKCWNGQRVRHCALCR